MSILLSSLYWSLLAITFSLSDNTMFMQCLLFFLRCMFTGRFWFLCALNLFLVPVKVKINDFFWRNMYSHGNGGGEGGGGGGGGDVFTLPKRYCFTCTVLASWQDHGKSGSREKQNLHFVFISTVIPSTMGTHILYWLPSS